MLLLKQVLRHSKTAAGSCALFALLLSSTARADTILTYLATGADPGSHNLDAQVTLDINPTSGLIKTTVSNLESDSSGQNLVDDGQLVVDVSIGIDENLSYAANSLTESAPYGSVNLDGSLNPVSTGNVTPSWSLAFHSGATTTITFCDNPGAPGCSGQWAGGGQHQQMIIGAGAGSNGLNYTGANSSLTNGNKNPDIFESAVFQISATGLPANLTSANIASVKVYFGTGGSPQSETAALQTEVPDASPVVLAVIGLTLILLTRKLR